MFTKKFHGKGGGQFSWGKINPGKCLPGKLPPIPQRKKKENWLQKILSPRQNIKEKEEMIRKLIKTKSLHSPR